MVSLYPEGREREWSAFTQIVVRESGQPLSRGSSERVVSLYPEGRDRVISLYPEGLDRVISLYPEGRQSGQPLPRGW